MYHNQDTEESARIDPQSGIVVPWELCKGLPRGYSRPNLRSQGPCTTAMPFNGARIGSHQPVDRATDWKDPRQSACRPVYHLYTSRRFSPIRVDSRPPDSDRPPQDDELYEVRVIDNDYNTYQEVIDITMLALQVSDEEAYAIAWEVDHKGSCVVAYGPRNDAEAIASIIRIIGIEVQVNPVGNPDVRQNQ